MSTTVEPGMVFQDMHKGNAGQRLVRVERITGASAERTTLTAGGRPCREGWTASPELRGTGTVGQTTSISLARLSKPYRFQPVNVRVEGN